MMKPPQDEDRGQRAAALAGDARAIKHLKDEVKAGKNWYSALLATIAMWRSTEEEYKGERYLYLVGGEAFDWLRLAERLCDEIKESIPGDELTGLLFFDRPPIEVSEQE
ncbi:MAG: hypothetical protein PHU70_06135, partial [Dehalococcoidia bacterium]|nr:hypothetical protein [Dehalococcoidia bacterium]